MANSAIVGIISGGGGGGAELEANQFKTLRFIGAPAVMEFSFTIGDGTDPVILTGGMNAAAIKAAIEASDDATGFTADVYGSTTTSEGTDGVLLHTGMFIVTMRGAAPFPAWTAVQDSEVQSFVVEEGDGGDYTLNSGGNFALGITEGDLQANQRALAGVYADVIVKGASQIRFSVSGLTGGHAGQNSDYAQTDTHDGKAVCSLNGEYPVTLGVWRLYFDSGTNCWCLSNGYDGGAGTGAFYWVSSVADFPPASGWSSYNGTPTVAPSHTAIYCSYFPVAVGSVTSPSATGTDAVVSTIYQGGGTSSVVMANSSTMEQALIMALQSPEVEEPSDAFTPANPSHWVDPAPTTQTQAIDRLSAFVYNYFFEPIP